MLVPDASTLIPVDEVTITVLVDNTYDSLATDTGPARRAGLSRIARIPATHFVGGSTMPGLRAEHGFAALVTVRRGASSRALLLDTGITPDGLLTNADLLGLDLSPVEAVVLSHGHFDHTGGLASLAARHSGLPLHLHPRAWVPRRVTAPGQEVRDLPTISRAALETAGFDIVERRGPSTLLDGHVLVTGEITRGTGYERGMPFHEAYHDGVWTPDPLLLDDQAVVVHVRDRGLVVLTGCGHAGAINTVHHARRLSGVDRLHALLGGLHLSGRAFEPVIAPTLDALRGLAPDLVVPAHCTGLAAQHRLASALPAAFVPSVVGSSYILSAGRR
ncbi:MAG: MBL fold metallo-hydrolase [Dactylosporangium sp.]|nr:MBL fold metallo-hydrolase [Dactylosporangium sp.]NNJ62552.1 MBL fold metallo-hydrolase [Dactylosporangium sp.]